MAKVSLDVQKRIECMLAGVQVIRMADKFDRTLTYQEFAKEVGLMGRAERWQPWHRKQVSDILDAIAAVDRQGGGSTINFRRIVNAATGQSGSGVEHESRITS